MEKTTSHPTQHNSSSDDATRALQALVARLEAENKSFSSQLVEQKEKQEAQQKKLQKTIESYQKTLALKDQLLAQHQERIDYLQEQLNLLLSKRFGRQSEQLKHLQGQLFDEAELETAICELEAELAQAQQTLALDDLNTDPSLNAEPNNTVEGSKEAIAPTKPATAPKRTPLPAHLKRVEIVVDVSDEDKQMMGDEWTLIGYETAEQLAVRDREYYVKHIKRAKYVRNADTSESAIEPDQPSGIKLAPPLPVILPKAIADASLLAHAITAKFVDALSFYRYERILSREGINIGYSTLCSWPIQLLNRMEPLNALLHEALTEGACWHLDETVLQVLDEPGREDTQKSYIWAIRSGPPDRPVIVFHYAPRRNTEALTAWLSPYAQQYHGVMVTDEHKPYNGFFAAHPTIQAHGGCWAHCRRKFADAAKGRKEGSDTHKVLQQISVLYRLEQSLGELKGEAKRQARDEKVRPQLERIKAFLEKLAPNYLKSGLMRTAIGYALNNWDKLSAFLSHPDLPLDNNPIENAIRPFTLGRKNFLFSGSPKGAEASAFLYSLIESAKANGWEPKAYLETLFERYPLAKTREEQRALLPMNLKRSI